VPDRALDVAAHVFVADLDGLELSDDDHHHLERVLRLRAGEEVTASDGVGGWRPCRWRGIGVGLEPDGDIVREPAPTPAIIIGFVVPKGDRPEWVVQKLTEAGVDRILPLVSARSVVRWDAARAAKHLERLRRVAREAAMQSRRVWLPAVEDVRLVAKACAELGPGCALAHPRGSPPVADGSAILVGPEGGWTPDEREGHPLVSLGSTVLRAETAALSASILLGALRAGIVRSVG
jgi:16S rRNA (uracil1498-N3)-methyltransferase